ncbi:amino acid-binding protein [Aeromicrobium camelliae]|uniref:Amino acid-binding protein n=1 Tax=Aeromicrobium camelliae TaxID=1538144 RepID=A0A3N6X5U3_9ACTN|nr:amino acid-binding protein [Aeromicrobium camelliae]RQN09013.1 amino acid-binding protein [Aeromicrobium camelliae]
MAFHLRVELPDVPGSLGALATALGSAGADIEAIEIVEHRQDGFAVDDVLLELPPSVMPDALITACHALDGVRVHWISRYAAGVNLSMDLEAVEAFTSEPAKALKQFIDFVPATFRTDWAMALVRDMGRARTVYASASAPELVPAADDWLDLDAARQLDDVPEWDSMVLAGAPGRLRRGQRFVVVVGRHGGPEFLPSEVARLGHMTSLAASVQDNETVDW